MNTTIDPMHPEILKSYKGAVQGDANDVVDIEFPSLNHASQWAMTCDITNIVCLRADTATRLFDQPVVIQFYKAGF